MRLKSVLAMTLFSALFLLSYPSRAQAQSTLATNAAFSASATSAAPAVTSSTLSAAAEIPDAPQPQSTQPSSTGNSDSPSHQDQRVPGQPTPAGDPSLTRHKPPPEPQRILGLMPNYRAVSAGVLPPPPTPGQAFKLATQNSFDYSSGVFVGITSLLAEGTEAHPTLGQGVRGFWGYFWRGFVDKADGNYWVIWIMPTLTHEDERYYARGEGRLMDRAVYAATRVLITPNYGGHNTFNASEVFGRGVSQAISLTYYPAADQNLGSFMEKYSYAVGRDALTNVFREFWPDIDSHYIHRHHRVQ